MSLRTPLAVTVVGALLVGGAATGTTLALWLDSEPVDAGSLGSGKIALTVDGASAKVFADLPTLALNEGTQPGASQSFSATLNNGSAGKNMRMEIFLDRIGAGTDALANGLEVAATAVTPGSECPATGQDYKALVSYPGTELTGEPLRPGTDAKLCVAVRVKAGASGVEGATGALSFQFRGQQVR